MPISRTPARTPTTQAFGDTAAPGVSQNAASEDHRHGMPAAPTAMPVGAMSMYGGSAAPSGWLLCDGSAVSRTTYAALFAILGTAYGTGDGSTTFNVPNLTQRFPMGVNGATNPLGQTGGTKGHQHDSLSAGTPAGTNVAEASHSHNVPGSTTGTASNANSLTTGGTLNGATPITHTHVVPSGQSGTGTSHNHAFTGTPLPGHQHAAADPPYVVVNFIVKT